METGGTPWPLSQVSCFWFRDIFLMTILSCVQVQVSKSAPVARGPRGLGEKRLGAG
jgi:hypothetical protein